MARGKFIVIDGGDGSGKDTQIELLKKHFPGDDFVFTRDPGGTDLGMKIREITQHGENVSRQTELFLLLASRAQLVHEVIEPALAAGKNVVSNRFDISTLAYQIYGRERHEEAELIEKVSEYARAGLTPDLVILLDMEPKASLDRLPNRNEKVNRFESEALDFHERVRKGYLASVRKYPRAEVIDAKRPVEEVWKDVLKAVTSVL
jgi:dTMP kinase